MVILTTHILRNDAEGLGHFGAPRGARTHQGVDLLTFEGEAVYAPIGGKVRIGYPYKGDTKHKLIEITSGGKKIKLMYVEPIVKNGQIVKAGQHIAHAQDVAKKYNSKVMKPHVHVEIRENNILIDPTEQVFSKKKVNNQTTGG